MNLHLSDGKAKMWRKKGNRKWSQAYSLICKAWWRWCHGRGMHGCLWNKPSQLYWWLNVWWQLQNEFGRAQNHLAYQYSRKCHQVNCEVLHQDNDTKHPARKEFIRVKKWKVLDCPSQSSDLNLIEHEFNQLKRRDKAEIPQNKQQLELAALKAGESISKDETKSLVMSMGHRLCN